LSAREQEVVQLIGCAFSNKEIARKLGVNLGTIKFHAHNILKKTGCKNRTAIAMALVGKTGGQEPDDLGCLQDTRQAGRPRPSPQLRTMRS